MHSVTIASARGCHAVLDGAVLSSWVVVHCMDCPVIKDCVASRTARACTPVVLTFHSTSRIITLSFSL